VSEIDSIELGGTYPPADLIAHPEELALDAAIDVYERFQLMTSDRKWLAGLQGSFMERHVRQQSEGPQQ
jgi:hypothetical protein